MSTDRDPISDNSHTLILCQFTDKANSKCYSDHESVTAAIEALLQLFETKLKLENADTEMIKYDISDVLKFIDDLVDVGILVYNANIGAYTPHSKDWLKRRLISTVQTMNHD